MSGFCKNGIRRDTASGTEIFILRGLTKVKLIQFQGFDVSIHESERGALEVPPQREGVKVVIQIIAGFNHKA